MHMIENIETLPKTDISTYPTNDPRLLGSALYADFRAQSANETSDSLNIPSVFNDKEVILDWSTWSTDRHLFKRTISREEKKHQILVPIKTPGQLVYDHKTRTWKAVDDTSPIGQIAKIRDEAKELVESTLTEESRKKLEAEYRIKLVAIYNSYTKNNFNRQHKVFRGNNFRGINLKYLASINLLSFRSDLIHINKQSRDAGRLFNRVSDESPRTNLKTPTQADNFLYSLLKEIHLSDSKFNQIELSQSAKTLIKLLAVDNPSESLIVIAHYFYGGNMTKTFQNISTVSKMTEQAMPEGWKEFHGNTTEFRLLARRLRLGEIKAEINGYLNAADEIYGGDMEKTFINTSAVAQMTGKAIPEGWQQFHGNTTEFRDLAKHLGEVSSNIEGYLATADKLYRGNMKKTFENISAVTQMTEQTMPKGWQMFEGNTTEFRDLAKRLSEVNVGIEGYINAARDLYRGDMAKTFKNISAVAQMNGQAMPDGWQCFHGNTTEFRFLARRLRLGKINTSIEGYLNIADELYKGDMGKTFRNISVVAHMNLQEIPERWRQFYGNTIEFRFLARRLRLGEISTNIDGYLTIADELYRGDMGKTFKSISAVTQMIGKPMPEGWKYFHGNTSNFKIQIDWVQSHHRATIKEFIGEFKYKSDKTAKLNFFNLKKLVVS